MLYIDVPKVDRDVAHVVMAIHICFKCTFQMFYLLQTNVASILSGFRMLHIHALQTYVSSVLRCFICMFASVSSECCICLQ